MLRKDGHQCERGSEFHIQGLHTIEPHKWLQHISVGGFRKNVSHTVKAEV